MVWTIDTVNGEMYSPPADEDWVVFKDFLIKSGMVEAEVKWSGAAGDDVGRGGIVVRCSEDRNNCYYFSGRREQVPYERWSIWRRLNGTWAQLAHQDDKGPAIDTWYKLQAFYIGNILEFYVDGERILGVVDDNLSSGLIGFYAHYGSKKMHVREPYAYSSKMEVYSHQFSPIEILTMSSSEFSYSSLAWVDALTLTVKYPFKALLLIWATAVGRNTSSAQVLYVRVYVEGATSQQYEEGYIQGTDWGTAACLNKAVVDANTEVTIKLQSCASGTYQAYLVDRMLASMVSLSG